jgi:hypothetical protein
VGRPEPDLDWTADDAVSGRETLLPQRGTEGRRLEGT